MGIPVPQMWIGSSLALACEGEKLPERRRALDVLASRSVPGLARVHVFDWGRSELNTEANHAQMSEDEQLMRKWYWDIWQRGAFRVFYESVVLYRRQFTSRLLCPEATVTLDVWDYDTMTENDHIGSATLPLMPTYGPLTLNLQRRRTGKSLKSTIEVEISNLQLPAVSRLSQAWRATVRRVNNLPRMDVF